jgi:ribonucleoside-diphosphate reductase alpha chain
LDKLEELANSEGLNNGLVEEVKRKYAYQKNPVKICRMLGFLLRHNVRIYKVVKALDEVEAAHPGTFVYRIKKFLAQFVRNVDEPMVCPECNEKSLVFAEGCYLCKSCGHTRC